MFSIKRRWPTSNPNHRRITSNSVDRYRKFNYSVVCKLILLLLMLAPIVPIMAQQPPPLVRVDQTQGENQIVSLQPDQELVVALEYNPSTGQTVKLQNLASLPVQLVKRVIKINSDLIGAPAILNLHFKGKWAGAAQLNFLSCRPWEECELPLKQLTVNLQTVGSFPNPAPQADNLFAANALADVMEIPVKEEVVIGYKRPHESKSSNNDFQSSSAEAPSLESNLSLPASFNWCDHGSCTPIKDQGSCGSCWAFSTVGPLESNILMKTGQTKDLAEQYLVSCNSNGWNCDKGGGFAHDYHWKKKISGEPGAGAVYESDFPYEAADVGCNPPHSPPDYPQLSTYCSLYIFDDEVQMSWVAKELGIWS